MTWIPYSELQSDDSGYSHLFIDYINNYDRLNSYFSADYRDNKSLQLKMDSILNRNISRSTLVQVLLDQNRDYHCGVKTLANIDLLLNDNTVAVVTGQQVGLFCGPLYTLYKTLTVLKLTDTLSQQFPDYNFVPVFWLEGEDHDIQEVNSFNLFNTKNELVNLQYDVKPTKSNFGAVGNVLFGDSIDALFENLNQSMIKTEFSSEVIELFKTAYQKGMTFSRAFIHLFNVLLEDSGLIFFDPHNIRTKRLLTPIFERELKGVSDSCRLVITQSELLEKQYHAQVKPRAVNLFMFHDGGRYAIEPHPDGFALKGTRHVFNLSEMLSLLESDPNMFSPNVVLRPICQDFLFPTLIYVAGPSEVSYFAQFKLLYEHFNIPMPVIYPRASITIIEENVQRIIDKYNLKFIDFFSDIDFLKSRIANTLSDFKIDELFTNTSGTVSESITSLKSGLAKIDPTLVPAMENTLLKMQNSLNILKEKTLAAQKRQHETSLRQLDKAALNLFPNSKLQEREINIIYYLNKYGLEFLRWLRGEIIIDKHMHQIINLE